MSYLGFGIHGQTPAIEIHGHEKGLATVLGFLKLSYSIYRRRAWEARIIYRLPLSQIVVPSSFFFS